jgi:hypothetical protein
MQYACGENTAPITQMLQSTGVIGKFICADRHATALHAFYRFNPACLDFAHYFLQLATEQECG